MRDRDFAWKFSRIIVPFLIYFLISLIVQVGVGGIIIAREMRSIDSADYTTAYTFFERINDVTQENVVLMNLVTSIVMIFVIFYLMYRDELYKKIEPVNFSGYGMIALLGISGALGMNRLVMLLPIDGILGDYEVTLQIIERSPIPLQILTIVFVTPFMEELFFRGLIYNRIKGYNDYIMASFLSSILFGLYHMNLVQGIYGFVMGMLMCLVYERYKSILAPIFMHILANGTAFIIGHNKLSAKVSDVLIFNIIVTLVEMGVFVVNVMLFIGVADKKGKSK